MWRVIPIRHVARTCPKGTVARRLRVRYASRQPQAVSQQPPSPTFLPSQADVDKKRRLPLVLASLTGAATAFYIVQLVIAANKSCPNPGIKNLAEQKDVSGRYDDTANSFDAEVGFSEWLMGVNKLRQWLAGQCKGHVLEVSCGTGRNLGFFDIGTEGEVKSLTFVDLSPKMVEVCRKKWDVLFGKQHNSLKPDLVVRFLPASALGQMPLAPTSPPRKYDAIIQTMGLCSTPHPAELLENMARHLDTSNPDARIFLLEHGRSYRDWMNNILDNSAEKHAEIHGCWFNRDIGALVEEAALKLGLEVVRERRHHVGTTWVFELKPKARSVANEDGDKAESSTKKSKSWFSWYN